MLRGPILVLLIVDGSRGQYGYGPVFGSNTGWAGEYSRKHRPSVTNGALRVQGDSRLYLVNDYMQSQWEDHKYKRLDLAQDPLSFTLDLSNVPCGCLACVYMVKMADPSETGSNYCDMAENKNPGLNGEECIELDVLEANNWAMQTAIHTEQGGAFGSGNCDRNGCFARVGGPASPRQLQNSYGPNKQINSLKPFNVESNVDASGQLTIQLEQDGKRLTTFDRHMAGACTCTDLDRPTRFTLSRADSAHSRASQAILKATVCLTPRCGPSRALRARWLSSSRSGRQISHGSTAIATSASSRRPSSASPTCAMARRRRRHRRPLCHLLCPRHRRRHHLCRRRILLRRLRLLPCPRRRRHHHPCCRPHRRCHRHCLRHRHRARRRH